MKAKPKRKNLSHSAFETDQNLCCKLVFNLNKFRNILSFSGKLQTSCHPSARSLLVLTLPGGSTRFSPRIYFLALNDQQQQLLTTRANGTQGSVLVNRLICCTRKIFQLTLFVFLLSLTKNMF